jgi:hypothetical protein
MKYWEIIADRLHAGGWSYGIAEILPSAGNNVGTVSAEIPVGPRWCEIRQTVFGWTTQKFPFSVKTAHALKIREPHVITVT